MSKENVVGELLNAQIELRKSRFWRETGIEKWLKNPSDLTSGLGFSLDEGFEQMRLSNLFLEKLKEARDAFFKKNYSPLKTTSTYKEYVLANTSFPSKGLLADIADIPGNVIDSLCGLREGNKAKPLFPNLKPEERQMMAESDYGFCMLTASIAFLQAESLQDGKIVRERAVDSLIELFDFAGLKQFASKKIVKSALDDLKLSNPLLLKQVIGEAPKVK